MAHEDARRILEALERDDVFPFLPDDAQEFVIVVRSWVTAGHELNEAQRFALRDVAALARGTSRPTSGKLDVAGPADLADERGRTAGKVHDPGLYDPDNVTDSYDPESLASPWLRETLDESLSEEDDDDR